MKNRIVPGANSSTIFSILIDVLSKSELTSLLVKTGVLITVPLFSNKC